MNKYIEEIIKNGEKSTYINGKEWFCEYYSSTTKEFILKKVDGDFIYEYTEKDINKESFEV